MKKTRYSFALSMVFVLCALAAWASGGLGGTPYSLATLSDGRVLYTTSENYTSGAMGIVDPSSGAISSAVRANLGGDATVFTFSKAGSDRVLIANRLSWGAQTEIQIFNPSDWTKPEWNGTVDGNLKGVTVLSDDLYLAYYGSGSGLGRLDKRALDSYGTVTLSRDIDKIASEDKGESILTTDGGRLFLMVQGFESFPSSMDNGALVQVSPTDLTAVSSVDVGINPVGMSSRGEAVYVASNGNYSSSAHKAWRIDGSTMARSEIKFAGFQDSGEFVQALFDSGTKLFILSSVFDVALGVNRNKVYVVDRPSSWTNPTNIDLGAPATTLDGWTVGSTLDVKGRLWVCSSHGTEGSVKGVGSDGSVETYPSSYPDSGGSGGGCSVGFAPSAVFLLAPILLLFRGR
nr:Synerg-CTERM sorting domain-containing protein [uncultured Dethiosulfovibrio sp.]